LKRPPPSIIRAILWVLLPVPFVIVFAWTLPRRSDLILTLLVSFGPLFLGQGMFLMQIFRLRRRLRAASWRLCLHCEYDLSGLEDSGPCPECGHPFDARADADRWHLHVGGWR